MGVGQQCARNVLARVRHCNAPPESAGSFPPTARAHAFQRERHAAGSPAIPARRVSVIYMVRYTQGGVDTSLRAPMVKPRVFLEARPQSINRSVALSCDFIRISLLCSGMIVLAFHRSLLDLARPLDGLVPPPLGRRERNTGGNLRLRADAYHRLRMSRLTTRPYRSAFSWS